MSSITVSGITPSLLILGDTQQFNYDQQTISSFQLNSNFVPTSLISPQTFLELRNNTLSGFRWIHTTGLSDTIGEFKLQSFVGASLTGTDIFTVTNENKLILNVPISIPSLISKSLKVKK